MIQVYKEAFKVRATRVYGPLYTCVIQGGPTLTIFAITRFLIIEKILRLARKRHTLWSYKPVPLFYLLSIGFRVKRR
jgi:hypothetical protein